MPTIGKRTFRHIPQATAIRMPGLARRSPYSAMGATLEQDLLLRDPGATNVSSYAHWMLDQEARALLDRLVRVKPFVLTEPMLLAASLLPAAQIGIERFLAKGRQELKERIAEFLSGSTARAGKPRRRNCSADMFFSGFGSIRSCRSSTSSIRSSRSAAKTNSACGSRDSMSRRRTLWRCQDITNRRP